ADPGTAGDGARGEGAPAVTEVGRLRRRTAGHGRRQARQEGRPRPLLGRRRPRRQLSIVRPNANGPGPPTRRIEEPGPTRLMSAVRGSALRNRHRQLTHVEELVVDGNHLAVL